MLHDHATPLTLLYVIMNKYLWLFIIKTFLAPLYKRIHIEMDISNKSDRVEWGHARYQRIFRPDQAYELVVEWLTSSGAIAAELVITKKYINCLYINVLD